MQRVQMRRLEQRVPMPSEVAMPLIVREDKQDVWFRRRFRVERCGGGGGQ
jgi:hypothetical protein